MEHMDVDCVIEETAMDAAAEADNVAVGEAAKDVHGEIAKEFAERVDKESSDHTDGIPAVGAPGATPATEPSVEPLVAGGADAEDQPTTSEAPSSSRYLEVGENLFISILGTTSAGVPTEGETFDEEITIAVGLKIVGEPRGSSSKSKEEQLQTMSDNFHQLQALHHARKEKLDSRATVVEAAAEADF